MRSTSCPTSPKGWPSRASSTPSAASKADGATHVVLRPMLVTDSVESSEFEDKADAPTDATLAAGIDAAEARGRAVDHPALARA